MYHATTSSYATPLFHPCNSVTNQCNLTADETSLVTPEGALGLGVHREPVLTGSHAHPCLTVRSSSHIRVNTSRIPQRVKPHTYLQLCVTHTTCGAIRTYSTCGCDCIKTQHREWRLRFPSRFVVDYAGPAG
jgi:hypothetical protein